MLFFSLGANPDASFVNGYSYGFGARSYRWPHGYTMPEGFLTNNLGTYDAVMVRKNAWQAVGGYGEKRTGGMEDWDFSLKLMNSGRWGYTVPEYVFWYRTRPSHTDRWTDLSKDGLKNFVKNVPLRFPNLAAKQFHVLPCPRYTNYQPIDISIEQPTAWFCRLCPRASRACCLWYHG
mmetsp:Transcript_13653/g.22536  ORF Transcript_13653/g.22536 Transcript_13653/m.22536 type:complete len:177 (-) Transcript_13653:2258-2788(-)